MLYWVLRMLVLEQCGCTIGVGQYSNSHLFIEETNGERYVRRNKGGRFSSIELRCHSTVKEILAVAFGIKNGFHGTLSRPNISKCEKINVLADLLSRPKEVSSFSMFTSAFAHQVARRLALYPPKYKTSHLDNFAKIRNLSF